MGTGHNSWARTARHALLVMFGYTLLFLLYFSPVLAEGRQLVIGDAVASYYPALAGERSLWEPLLYSGYPRMADPQMMMWYPPAVLCAYAGNWWNAFLLSGYILGSSFAYGLVYRQTRSVIAAAASGIIYGMSGFFMAHMSHVTIIHAAAWVPLVFWSLNELRFGADRRWIAALALATGNCFLAGHPQIFFTSMVLAGLFVLFHLPGAVSRWPRLLAGPVLGIALGVGVATLQLFPTMELADLSYRDKLSFEEFSSFSLPAEQISQLAFPFAYGGMFDGGVYNTGIHLAPFQPYFGRWNLAEITGFCGLLTFVLACLGVVSNYRSRTTWFWVLAACLGVTLALGDDTPLARWIYQVPVINQFRSQGRYLLFFTLAMVALAGMGAAALAGMSRREGFARLASATALVGIGLALLWRMLAGQVESQEMFAPARASAPAGSPAFSSLPWVNPMIGIPLTFLLLGIVALALWNWRRGAVSAALLLVVLAADTGQVGWFTGWRFWSLPADFHTSVPEMLAGPRDHLLKTGERLFTLEAAPLLNSTAGHETEQIFDNAPLNISTLWGIRNAWGYMSLPLKRYTRLISARWPYHSRLAEMTATGYAVSPILPKQLHGIEWNAIEMQVPALGPTAGGGEDTVSLPLPNLPATRVAFLCSLGGALDYPQGEPLVEMTALTREGAEETWVIRAGVHAAEQMAASPDFAGKVRHQLPDLAEDGWHGTDSAGRPFPVRRYVSVFPLRARAEVASLRFRWVGPDHGDLRPVRITLIDDTTGRFYPAHDLAGDPDRWQVIHYLPNKRHVLLRNRHPLPRAWLASRVLRMDPDEICTTLLGTGKLPDGTPHDLYETALVETPDEITAGPRDPEAVATVGRETPSRVEIFTQSKTPAFLVYSGVNYPGWIARVDGVPAEVVQTDYILRGVPVPAGAHKVEFLFRPMSFYLGVVLSGICGFVIVCLIVTAVRNDIRHRTRPNVG